MTSVFLFLLATFITASQPHTLHRRIIGGQPEQHALPWLMALTITKPSSTIVCSGMLISTGPSTSYILTAAHCCLNATSISALGGRYDLAKSTQDEGGAVYHVAYTFIHSGYDPGTSANDIALLGVRLVKNYGQVITPISIASPSLSPSSFTAYGWGLTSPTSKTSTLLMMGTLLPVDQDTCIASYGAATVTDNVICAGSVKETTCKGDSGGPLTAVDAREVEQLVGITSFGDSQCGSAPSGFTRVDMYADWIGGTMNNTAAMDFSSAGVKEGLSLLSLVIALMLV